MKIRPPFRFFFLSVLKQTRNFIHFKFRPGDTRIVAMGLDTLAGAFNFSDTRHGNAFFSKVPASSDVDGFGSADNQQAAGTDQSQRMNLQQLANPRGLGQNRNAIQVDVKLMATGAA
jgi:hypothetical protein